MKNTNAPALTRRQQEGTPIPALADDEKENARQRIENAFVAIGVATFSSPRKVHTASRWGAATLLAIFIVVGNAEPAAPTSEALGLKIIQLQRPGPMEVELSARQPGTFVIEESLNLTDWTPVSTNEFREGLLSTRTAFTVNSSRLFFRLRQVSDPSLGGTTNSLVISAEQPTVSFRFTVTGSAIESWNEQAPEQKAYQQLWVGDSRTWSLFTAVRDEPVVLNLKATVRGTRASVQLWERGSFGERTLVGNLSCQVGEWDFQCTQSQPITLRAFKNYEWQLTVTGTSTLGDGSAELTGYRQILLSVRVNGTTFSKDATITRAESPKDLGSFSVRFTPTHGGTISSKSFQVTSSNPDVAVKFSDTQSTTTGSETAHVIATTTKGCGDCNNNGIDDCVEISNGSVTDCNGNGIPDECEIGDLAVIYVNASNNSCQNGLAAAPFKTVERAYTKASAGDTLRIMSGSYPEKLVLLRAVRLEAVDGRVSIGFPLN